MKKQYNALLKQLNKSQLAKYKMKTQDSDRIFDDWIKKSGNYYITLNNSTKFERRYIHVFSCLLRGRRLIQVENKNHLHNEIKIKTFKKYAELLTALLKEFIKDENNHVELDNRVLEITNQLEQDLKNE